MNLKEKFYFWRNRKQEYKSEEDVERENNKSLGCVLLGFVVAYTIGISALFYNYMENNPATKTGALREGNLERNVSRVIEPNAVQLDNQKKLIKK